MFMRSLIVAALFVVAGPALADWHPDAWFVEGGKAPRGTWAATAGVKWTGAWRRNWVGAEATGAVDLQVSHWEWDRFGGGHTSSNVLSLVPLLRLRFSEDRSPWFFEGGIGLDLADKRYNTPNKQFSTAYNFHDVLALGRNVGSGSEITLRAYHSSNAGIRHPNPGENFVQVRWGSKF